MRKNRPMLVAMIVLVDALVLTCVLPLHAKEFDLGTMQPGERKQIVWEGMVVQVYRRTAVQIAELKSQPIQPQFSVFNSIIKRLAKIRGNAYGSRLIFRRDLNFLPLRSEHEEFLVVDGSVPAKGCVVGV